MYNFNDNVNDKGVYAKMHIWIYIYDVTAGKIDHYIPANLLCIHLSVWWNNSWYNVFEYNFHLNVQKNHYQVSHGRTHLTSTKIAPISRWNQIWNHRVSNMNTWRHFNEYFIVLIRRQMSLVNSFIRCKSWHMVQMSSVYYRYLKYMKDKSI